MIEDPEHPQMKRAMDELKNHMRKFLGRKLSPSHIREVGDLLAWHRRTCRQSLGVDFPVLVAFVFPRLGQIDLVRADLPHREIEQTIVNFTVKYPDVTAEEVAFALKHAFPDYRHRGLKQ